MVDSIFIPRGGTEEKRLAALNAIKDRQMLIENEGGYNQLLMFPEGCTTNGAGIVKFKKGAFWGEATVKPIILKYSLNDTVIPSYDCAPLLALAWMQLSWACMSCEIISLPDFQPTDYLFETHKDKGKERWEIYAWATRDLMCKKGQLGQDDRPWKEKLQYEAYMKCDPKFKTFIYTPPAEEQKKEPQTDDNLLSPENQSHRRASPNDAEEEIQMENLDKKQNDDNVAAV